jgi:TorA maturation chaperone TorD
MQQNRVRSDSATTLARLISRPDEELIDTLNSGELYQALASAINAEEIDLRFLRDENYTLETMRERFNAGTAPVGPVSLLLVESLYKPWTDDRETYPMMHGEKGYLMGDPALHMLELYGRLGFEIPGEFSVQPDHLVLELEFLSVLYEQGNDAMVYQFMKDHLDWVPDCLAQCTASGIAPFYCSVLRIIEFYMKKERSRIESLHEVNT